jgi:hypothetical protein
VLSADDRDDGTEDRAMTKKTKRKKLGKPTARDLEPRRPGSVKGGLEPQFLGGVRVATGDVNAGGKVSLTTR